ncbi:MAG: hypothetical protein QNJ75_13310 [Acidimicrobiia bacterium]|nr:hypothetical protein [Acidimicrobiia bacterium]
MLRKTRTGWRVAALSPRLRSALGGILVGATLSLLLVALPLLMLSTASPEPASDVETEPLAALSSLPAEPARFDISAILTGEWVGEVCPDRGEPIPVSFEFATDEDSSLRYSMLLNGKVQPPGILGGGTCDVDGEAVTFHAFLAILTDCDVVCAVDRLYEGHFEQGGLVGSYHESVGNEDCLPCIGRGSWWLRPAD